MADPYEVEFTRTAYGHLRAERPNDRNAILDAIREQLTHTPAQETRNRKLLRETPLADWELRVGRFRVFYEVDAANRRVRVLAVGVKERTDAGTRKLTFRAVKTGWVEDWRKGGGIVKTVDLSSRSVSTAELLDMARDDPLLVKTAKGDCFVVSRADELATEVEPLRDRLGAPFATSDAPRLAKELFGALEGDLRVRGDTILVTYHNAPHVERLREHFERLPSRLDQEAIDPRVPWLYGLEVDFRFR